MDFSRNKTWLLPLAILVLAPLWQPPVARFLAPRESKIVFTDKKANGADDRNLHLYGITLSQSTGDRVEMELTADSVATGGSGSEEFHFQNIDCRLYNEEGVPTRVTGGEALFVTAHNLITIIEDVTVVTGDGKYRVRTDALRYFTHYKVAKTATPVVFESEGTRVTGDTMMYNLTTGAFRVGGNVVFTM